MRKATYITLIFMMLTISCKKSFNYPEDCGTYDYYDCVTQEPIVSLATFKFTINDEIQTVPFIIYKGNIENGEPLFYDTARGEKQVSYYLYFGNYSVKAEYKTNGSTIYAVDGGELEVWKNEVCDSICWGWDSLHLDLQLK